MRAQFAELAGALYDKFVAFVQDLDEIGNRLQQLERVYSAARNKLVEGSGNLVGRVEKLKLLGARASRSLPVELLEQAAVEPLAEGLLTASGCAAHSTARAGSRLNAARASPARRAGRRPSPAGWAGLAGSRRSWRSARLHQEEDQHPQDGEAQCRPRLEGVLQWWFAADGQLLPGAAVMEEGTPA
ncbi:hypothetical protein GCM10027514_39850 [Azotobacter armeniacus]